MPLNSNRTRELIASFDFKNLFIEELGWDHNNAQLNVYGDNQTFTLSAVAEKRGMVVFVYAAHGGERIPDYSMRRKIERQVTKSAYEHLIIFIDENKTIQIWQWVKREHGKPSICREHTYRTGQQGDALIQKLHVLVFSLKEEETLALPDVTGRVKHAFDVEHVTKRFYDRFKDEHTSFLKFLKGIPDNEMERWYVSVMLNRLMFIYFIQKKGFLNNDTDYLRHKLNESKARDKDRFYQDFLCPLFFEGFAKNKEERSEKIQKLLGEIPYLNGGIFMQHQIEKQYGKDIEIPDKSFESLFDFFDEWEWHLEVRQNKPDNEINPDVLGYIFEKYINQKQMGAYYTKEDITEYISKNTVIPFLFDTAKKKCKVAFEGEHSIWHLLKDDPDRYIYNAVKHGIKVNIYEKQPKLLETPLPLPQDIAIGLHDVSKREDWNKPAPSDYALPTEIWREVVARRKRYEEIFNKLVQGDINSINDFITYNLDMRQFVQDVISNAEGPDLLYAFWQAIEHVTILDPTVGSGAFLFAALNILEPLYEACLDRMESFLEEWDNSGSKDHPNYSKLFKEILSHVDKHPNRPYFIFKSIIVNNLYGVDIMEEAVEICKLRLFLKLVAQIERAEDIEPLPDIDFNIRAGNTLVGFVSIEQIKHAAEQEQTGQGRLMFGEVDKKIKQIEEKAEVADHAFQMFHKMQTEEGMSPKDFSIAKGTLRDRLKELANELDQYMALEYKIDVKKKKDFEKWCNSHQPFHWFTEFYGIIKSGGFDVVIGNPPYLELRQVAYVPKNYACLTSGTIHAMCIERGARLLNKSGCMSMIVPMSLPSTQRMQAVQQLIELDRDAWYANYAWRPAKLFDTVNRALTIFVVIFSQHGRTFSTNYQKWMSDNRDGLFERIGYIEVLQTRPAFWIPKLGYALEQQILKKCLISNITVERFIGSSDRRVYYRTTGGLYWKIFTDFAPAFRLNGRTGHSSRETWFTVVKRDYAKSLIAILSSDIFWWWYTVTSNLRDLNPYDIKNFPLPESALADPELHRLGQSYLKDIDRNSMMLVREQKQTGRTETQCFKIQMSKPLIDEIDRVLARHYGFTEEELDFIINYDIKYRMGKEAQEDDSNES